MQVVRLKKMELIAIFISVVGCIILFDFAITGLIPLKTGISPAINDLNLGKLLIEEFFSTFKTDLENFKKQGRRIHWKSAILTERYFLIKLTRLTYKFSVHVENIKRFEVIKSLTGKRIKLIFSENNEEKFFEFNPRNSEEWKKQLISLGIKEEKENQSNHLINRTENTSVQN